MDINKAAVLGAGRMGRQIGLCAAIHGVETYVYDNDPEVIEDVRKWAEEYLAGRIAKGRMTEEQVAAAKALFHPEPELAKAVRDVDLVIEAVVEIKEVKNEVFDQIRDLIDDRTIIATNSSVMVSSQFKDHVKHPDKLCNMHFYNPALVMTFVEVVQGEHTSTETAESVYNFCRKLGKKPAWQKKEIPGFIGNYCNGGLRKNAFYLVEHGYCTYQDIDIALEEGFHHKMGQFRMIDLTGGILPIYRKMESQYKETGVKPDMYDTFKDLVDRERLGKSVGHGFYDYVDDGKQ